MSRDRADAPIRNPNPVGFPILIDPADVGELLAAKVAMDEATVALDAIGQQMSVLQKQAEALRDEQQHAATGIRIKARVIAAANRLPDTAALVIDTVAGTVEFVDRPPRVRG